MAKPPSDDQALDVLRRVILVLSWKHVDREELGFALAISEREFARRFIRWLKNGAPGLKLETRDKQ